MLGSYNYWVVENDPSGDETVLAGPIPVEDETGLEMALLKLFRRHPWDTRTDYKLIVVDPKGCPEIERLPEDYIGYIMDLAWNDDPDYPIDDLEDEEEED